MFLVEASSRSVRVQSELWRAFFRPPGLVSTLMFSAVRPSVDVSGFNANSYSPLPKRTDTEVGGLLTISPSPVLPNQPGCQTGFSSLSLILNQSSAPLKRRPASSSHFMCSCSHVFMSSCVLSQLPIMHRYCEWII